MLEKEMLHLGEYDALFYENISKSLNIGGSNSTTVTSGLSHNV